MAGKRCCCGCCSVRDGTKIIGILCIVGGALYILLGLYFIWLLRESPKQFVDTLYPTLEASKKAEIEETITSRRTSIIAYFVACIVVVKINIIFAALLLYGLSKNDKSKCKPFLYYNGFFVGLSAVISIIAIIFQLIAAEFLAAIIFLIIMGGCLAFQAYILKVIYDCMQELGEGSSASGHVYAPTSKQIEP